jgi:NADH-quinone oxidoreductase subunit L
MWIATLAISGVPPFAGFFSKDEILGGVFERAQDSTLASASLLGIPGSAVMYLGYILGLAAALMTATYMTRMMLYTFHGPNRTGDREREHLHDAPWMMTGPLVVLGILSAVGGWLNLPSFASFLGPVAGLEHWLDPVVGHAALIVTGGHTPAVAESTEYMLVGAAVAIAIAGIALAWVRLKPESLPTKAAAHPAHGFENVLEHKYYVDEVYDAALVRPTVGISRQLLWRGIDAGLIDGLLVNGSATLARFAGWIGSQLQSGLVGTYAWVLVVGVLAVLGAFTMR